MSKTITLELCSAFRNREKYPNSSYFEVDINGSNCGNCGKCGLNIVSEAYPIYNFVGSGTLLTGIEVQKLGINNFSYLTGICSGGEWVPRSLSGINIEYGGRNVISQNNVYGVGNGLEPNLNINKTSDKYLDSSNLNDYYTGNYLFKLDSSTPQTDFSNLIVEYIGITRTTILQNSVSNWSAGLNIGIRNNSFGSTNKNQIRNANYITIQGGESIDGYYDGFYLEDVSIRKVLGLNERFILITKYNGTTKIATAENGYMPFFGAGLDSPYHNLDWTNCDMYRIRKKKPIVMGFGYNFVNNTAWIYDGILPATQSTLNVDWCTAGIGHNNLYKNGVIEVEYISGQVNKGDIIELYPGNILIEILGDDPVETNVIYPGKYILDNNIQIGENVVDDMIYDSSNTIQFKIVETGQVIDISRAYNGSSGVCDNLLREVNAYNGQLFFIPLITEKINVKKGNIPQYYRQYPIFLKNNDKVDYFPMKNGCTIIYKFMYGKYKGKEYAFIVCENHLNEELFETPSSLNKNKNINPIKVEEDKIYWKFIGYTDDYFYHDWEILPADNLPNTFNVIGNGSSTSLQTEVCYKVNISSLTLPNLKLNSGNIKGLLAFNPDIHIELNVIDKFNMNTMLSNNINAKSALFKIPLYDISNPNITSFIKIGSFNMQPIVKFKPNDNLVLRVYFGNNQLVLFDKNDFAPPMLPDPLKQITINIELNRIM